MGNYIETIDDIVMESEIEILMKMGDMFTKQFVMESYYMEEEPKEEPKEEKNENTEKAPKVDGVNALKRFWNWLRRCIYAIRTRISHYFADKSVKKTIDKLSGFKPDEMIAISNKTYTEIERLIKEYLNPGKRMKDKADRLVRFDPKINYQQYAASYEKIASFHLRQEYSGKNEPQLDEEDQVNVKASKLIDIFKKFKEMLQTMHDEVVNVEKNFKEVKSNLDEETIKSNNFQQYVRFMTASMKLNFYLIKEYGSWCKLINMTLSDSGQKMFKSYTVAKEAPPITYFREFTKEDKLSDVGNAMKEYVNKSPNGSAHFQWYNTGNDKYKNSGYRRLLQNVLSRYPISDYDIVIVATTENDTDRINYSCMVIPAELDFKSIAKRVGFKRVTINSGESVDTVIIEK
jgi:hypothetical protein